MAPQVWTFLGQELERLRKDKGWTRAQLVERILEQPECEGTFDQTVYKWERGRGRPTLPQSLALERIFRVPVRKWYAVADADAAPAEPDQFRGVATLKVAPKPLTGEAKAKQDAAWQMIVDDCVARGEPVPPRPDR